MKNSGGSGARTSGPQSSDLWSDDCNVVAPHWSPDEDVQRLRTGGPRSEVRHPEQSVGSPPPRSFAVCAAQDNRGQAWVGLGTPGASANNLKVAEQMLAR